jgi:hypothetical protein
MRITDAPRSALAAAVDRDHCVEKRYVSKLAWRVADSRSDARFRIDNAGLR